MRKSIKILALALVAILATSCVVSTTLAKYSSKLGEGSATVRVANWGLTSTTVTVGNFATSYGSTKNPIAKSAQSPADSIIAPGTSGAINITIADTDTAPEVAYKLIVSLDGSDFKGKEILSSGMKFAIQSTNTTAPAAASFKTIDEFENYETKVFAAGKKPGEQVLYLYWEWVDGEGEEAIANTSDIKVNVTVTAVQSLVGPAIISD